MRTPCGMCGARAVEGAIAELNREIAQTILTEAGLQAVSVENGKLAVDKLYAMMRKCLK